MLLNELLQPLMEASELSKLGFSDKFISGFFKKAYLKHSASFKKIAKKELTIKFMRDHFVVAKTPKGEEVGLLPAYDNNLLVIEIQKVKNKYNVLDTFNGAADAFRKIPAGSEIYATKKEFYYTSRDKHQSELRSEDREREMGQFLTYMQETFGKRLQAAAEDAIEYIFRAMRHLDKRTRQYTYDKTEAEVALENIAHIEELAERGFTQKAAEGWYETYQGYNSRDVNIMSFVKRMKEPLAAAEFVKMIFSEIKEAKAAVMQIEKARAKLEIEKLRKSAKSDD